MKRVRAFKETNYLEWHRKPKGEEISFVAPIYYKKKSYSDDERRNKRKEA